MEFNRGVAGVSFEWFNPATESRLSRAVRNNDMASILSSDPDNVNLCDNRGYTALHCAAELGRDEMIDILIQKGALINHVTFQLETPLYLACLHGNSQVAFKLIKYDADITLRNNQRQTPLHAACKCGNADLVKILLSAGSDIEAYDVFGDRPLSVAVKSQNLEIVKILLDSNAKTEGSTYSYAMLTTSCLTSDTLMFDTLRDHLLKNGAKDVDIYNFSSKDGYSLLMAAAENHNLELVKKLIFCGADTSKVDDRGLLALHIAAHSGRTDIFKIILENTDKAIIEKYASMKFKEDPLKCAYPISITSLLIDKRMYEGLEILFSSNLDEEVICCPIVIVNVIYTPIHFLLLTPKNPNEILSCLDLLLSQDCLVKSLKTSPLSLIRMVIKLNDHGTHFVCTFLEKLLNLGITPILKDYDYAFQFQPALEFLVKNYLSYSPEFLFMRYITDNNFTDESILQCFLSFFSHLSLDLFPIKSKDKFDQVSILWQFKSLQHLARCTVRKQVQEDIIRENSNEVINTRLKRLLLPETIINYICFRE